MPSDKKAYREKSESSSTVNFVCMIFGMITTIVGTVGGYQQFTKTPEVVVAPGPDETNIEGFNVDIENNINVAPKAKDPVLSAKDEFQRIKAEGTNDEINDYLNRLADWPRASRTTVKIDFQNKIIELADLLMEKDPSEDHKQNAILSRIRAYSVLYGLAVIDPKLREESLPLRLLADAEPYTNHENPDIRREAILTVVKVDSFEYKFSEDLTMLPKIEADFEQLWTQLPEDEKAAAMASRILNSLVETNNDFGSKLLDRAEEVYSASPNVSLQKLARDLHDQNLMAKTNITNHLRNRFINGVESKKAIYDACMKMTEDPKLGEAGLQTIANAMHWFEQVKNGAAIADLAVKIEKNAEVNEAALSVKYAKSMAESFQKRNELIGNAISLKAGKADGTSVDVSQFEDQIVVLAFADPAQENSLNALNRIVRLQKLWWAGKGVKVFVVFMRPESAATEKLREQAKNLNWEFSVGNLPSETDGPTILNEHPITVYPLVTLVDHRSIVKRVNVPLEQLKFEVEFMIEDRFREGRKK